MAFLRKIFTILKIGWRVSEFWLVKGFKCRVNLFIFGINAKQTFAKQLKYECIYEGWFSDINKLPEALRATQIAGKTTKFLLLLPNKLKLNNAANNSNHCFNTRDFCSFCLVYKS